MRVFTALTAGAAALLLSVGVASAQPLLHYNFDEGSGTTAADSGSGVAADGTLVGGATWTTNTPGGFSPAAVDLSAANTYVTTADPDKLDGLSQFTLKAWVNLQGAPTHGNRIMSKQNPGGAFEGFSFAFNNPTDGAANLRADNFQLNMALGGSGGFTFNISGANLDADNKWVFVAATYDGTQTSGNLQFWSGDELASVSPLGPTLNANSGTLTPNDFDFRVGAQSAGTSSAPVWIDNVEVYDRVLSLAELEANRLGNLVPEPASLALLGLGLLGCALAGRRRRNG